MGRFDRTTRLRTARFPSVGSRIDGTVLVVKDVAVPEFDAHGKIVGPKFDVNGTMLTQPDIFIQTPDGEETVIHANTGIQVAIGAALQEHSIRDLLPGDHLSLVYASDEDADELNPAKVYEAEIARPKSAAAVASAGEQSAAEQPDLGTPGE